MIKSTIYRHNIALSMILFMGLLFGFLILTSPRASAAYDGGRIIDNSVFLDSSSMTKSQIQNFLESKNSGIASMQFRLMCYGADSQERQLYEAAGADCDTNIPASDIIYYAAQIYGVNPQVILATAQKEQSLITAQNPTSWQLNQAMGYACPTSGNCEGTSSFPYQIDSGTWALRWHYERANGNNSWWRVSSGWTCGTEKNFYKPNLYPGQNVRFYDQNNVRYRTHFIENAATSAFYCYTPHAYNNPQGLYGRAPYGTTGMYYSGSYNFVLFFEQWFGSTKGAVMISRNLQFSPSQPKAGGVTSVSFKVKNTSDIAVTIDRLVAAARDPQNNNLNFPTVYDVTLDPGEEYTYFKSKVFYQVEDLTFSIAAYRQSGWTYKWPQSISNNIKRVRETNVVEPNVVISRSLFHSPAKGLAGSQKKVSFRVKNNENRPINVGKFTVAVRDENNNNLNFTSDLDITLSPGQTYEYYESQILNKAETYDIAIANHRPERGWSYTWPKKAYSSIVTDRSFDLSLPDVRLTRSLFESPANISAGEVKKVSFIIKNFENKTITIPKLVVAARDKNGANVNFPVIYNLELGAGESYEYYEDRRLSQSGEYSIWIATYTPDNRWAKNWPVSSSSSIRNERTFNVLP